MDFDQYFDEHVKHRRTQSVRTPRRKMMMPTISINEASEPPSAASTQRSVTRVHSNETSTASPHGSKRNSLVADDTSFMLRRASSCREPNDADADVSGSSDDDIMMTARSEPEEQSINHLLKFTLTRSQSEHDNTSTLTLPPSHAASRVTFTVDDNDEEKSSARSRVSLSAEALDRPSTSAVLTLEVPPKMPERRKSWIARHLKLPKSVRKIIKGKKPSTILPRLTPKPWNPEKDAKKRVSKAPHEIIKAQQQVSLEEIKQMYEQTQKEERRRNVIAIAVNAFSEGRRASAFDIELNNELRPRAATDTFNAANFPDLTHLNTLQFTSTRRASYQVQMDLMHSRVNNELAAIESQLDPRILNGSSKKRHKTPLGGRPSDSASVLASQSHIFAKLSHVQIVQLRKSWRHINNKGLNPSMTRVFHKLESRCAACEKAFNDAAAASHGPTLLSATQNNQLGAPSTPGRQHLTSDIGDLDVRTVNDHVKYLIAFFNQLIESLDANDTQQKYSTLLQDIGRRHAILRENSNVRADAFDMLGHCLVETITALDGVKQNKETCKAWRAVLAQIIDDLRFGYEQGCRRRASFNEVLARQHNADIVQQFRRMKTAEQQQTQTSIQDFFA